MRSNDLINASSFPMALMAKTERIAEIRGNAAISFVAIR